MTSVWETRLKDVRILQKYVNKVVMDYLVTEGYADAAKNFQIESGTDLDSDLATIAARMAVRKAVLTGDIEDAIKKVNDINPTLLDANPQLYFRLQQQRMIELIRGGKVEEAIDFAREELAPKAQENQNFLEELEKTVCLVAFEDTNNCPYRELIDQSRRLKISSEVNAALQTSQGLEKDAKLVSLLKALRWYQDLLREDVADPYIGSLATSTHEDPNLVFL